MKFFTTAGPVNPEKHYFVPHRLNTAQIKELIEQEKYFILHAPRQSGKTTAFMQLVQQLNEAGTYKALYVNIEAAQAARSDIKMGMEIILDELQDHATRYLSHNDPIFKYIEAGVKRISGISLKKVLQAWCIASEKPIILFIDEIDALVGDTLIAVLRQIRSGYVGRPASFPQSICLIGVRDVRDYRIWSDETKSSILGGSAFNIKAESLTLPNFSQEQVRYLYQQHTQETGQQFTDDAIDYAFEQTQGQPWLANALAYEACFEMVTDRSQAITKEVINRAKETLIIRRDTHIDTLVARLNEPRVRAIIEAILIGQDTPESFPTDDISYVIDLGLVSKQNQRLTIANPIYQEVIPRELSHGTQLSITQELVWYKNPDGTINMSKLLQNFTQFYRENSEIWLEKFDYKESGPHLLLMAFLQRIINGGGSIHREYGLGRKRVDLLVGYATQRIVIELKILRNEKTLPDGLEQTAQYMDSSNATEGHLVIFDRSTIKNWDEKIYQRQESCAEKTISVWCM